MNTYGRNAAELEKRRAMIVKELEAAEAVVGEKLFSTDGCRAGEGLADSYAALKEEIGQVEGLSEQIMSAAKKKQSLQKELELVQKERDKLLRGWGKIYSGLGEAAVETGPDSRVPGYDTLYGDIIALKTKRDAELHSAASAGEEGGNIWNRLKGSFAKMSRSGAVRQMETRLDVFYTNVGKLIFTSGSLEEAFKAGNLPEKEQEGYGRCAEYAARLESYGERINGLKEQVASVSDILEKNGAGSSADRFLDTLRQRLDEKRRKQRELCLSAGRAFSNLYFLADGEELAPYEGGSADGSSNMTALLERVRNVRRDLSECQCRIDMQTVSRDIEAADKKIAHLQNSLAANKREIDEIEQRNAELEKKIGAAAEEKSRLVLRRGELEGFFSKISRQLPPMGKEPEETADTESGDL